MKTTLTRIDADILRRLKIQSAIDGKSMTSLLSELIKPGLSKLEKSRGTIRTK